MTELQLVDETIKYIDFRVQIDQLYNFLHCQSITGTVGESMILLEHP